MQITQQRKNRRKRRYAAPIGGLFIGLAVFGVITVVFLCFRLTSAVLDNSKEKTMFENILRPVAISYQKPLLKYRVLKRFFSKNYPSFLKQTRL